MPFFQAYEPPPTPPPVVPLVDRGELVFPAWDHTYYGGLTYRDISVVVPSDNIPTPPPGFIDDRYLDVSVQPRGHRNATIIWARWEGYYPWSIGTLDGWVEVYQDDPIRWGDETWVFWHNIETNNGHMPDEMRFQTAGVYYHRPNTEGYEPAVFHWAGPADLNVDGQLTLFDYTEFQTWFDEGDMRADYDRDGTLTFFDFLAYAALWPQE